MRETKLVQHVAFSWCLLAANTLLVILTGCQPSHTTVTGKVTVDGQPVSAAGKRGTIIFHPVGGQGTTLTGVLDEKGNFRLATGASSEVAPGEYKVAVSIVELLPKVEGAEQGARRVTPAKYASPSESGLQAEVVAGPNEFAFNLESDSADESPAAANTKTAPDEPLETEPADADEKSNESQSASPKPVESTT